MKNQKLKALWSLSMRSRNLAETTIQNYAGVLRSFDKLLGQKRYVDVASKDLERYFAHLGKRVSQRSVDTHIETLKTFFNYLHDQGYMVRNVTGLLPRPKRIRKLKRVPTVQQIRRMIQAPDLDTKTGYRDRAMIIVQYSGGLRAMELLGLETSQVDEIKNTITVVRKGREVQEIPIGGLAMEYLGTFIREIRPLFHPRGHDLVWVNRYGKPMQDSSYWTFLKKHLQGVGLGKFTSHSLRHAAATHMLANGAPIHAIQAFLGHREINSTAIYTRVDQGQLRDVVDRMGW